MKKKPQPKPEPEKEPTMSAETKKKQRDALLKDFYKNVDADTAKDNQRRNGETS